MEIIDIWCYGFMTLKKENSTGVHDKRDFHARLYAQDS